jgi:two-component system cell cycle sensor histidine kinase/response regulator CckA
MPLNDLSPTRAHIVPRRRTTTQLVGAWLACCLLAFGILAWWSNREIEEQTVSLVDRLDALAQSRVAAVETWLSHVRADARLAARQLTDADVRHDLTQIVATHGYARIDIYGSDGARLFATDLVEDSEEIRQAVKRSLAERREVTVEIGSDAGIASLIGFVIPVLPGESVPRAFAARPGAVLLLVNPRATIFPVLNAGALGQKTAEVYLASVRDSRLQYLSPRAGAQAAAGKPGTPATWEAKALESRVPFGGEFYDEGGARVLAAVRFLPSEKWAVIARLELEEGLAPTRRLLEIVWAAAIALLFSATALTLATHRRIQARRLETSAERDWQYRTLVEEAQEGVAAHVDGKIVLVNPAALKLFRLDSEEQILGTDFLDWLPPPEPSCVSPGAPNLALPATYEATLRRTDGASTIVEVNTSPAHFGGRPGGQAVLRDITERKNAEARLARSRSLLEATLESTAEGIVVINHAGEFRRFNQRAVEMWGVPKEMLTADGTEKVLRFALEQLVEPDALLSRLQQIRLGETTPDAQTLELRDGRLLEFVSRPQRVRGEVVGHVWSFRDVSRQKQAEESLAESARRYRLLFERNLAGVYRSAPDGKLLECNDSFARIYGFESVEDALSHTAGQLYEVPDDRAVFLEKLRNQGRLVGVETRGRRKDGAALFLLENVSLVPGEPGTPEILEGTILDITERRRSEEALRISEAKHRLLFENSPLPMWVFDEENLEFLAVNEAACQGYGYTREEFLSMTIEEIRPSEDVEKLREHISHLTPDLRNSGIWRHLRRDGSILEVEIVSHPLAFSDRRAQMVLAIDVTERRLTERRIQERTTYLNALVENSPIALLALDSGHRIQMANPAFVRLFGYSPEELLGRDPDGLICPEDPKLRNEAGGFTNQCLSGRSIRATTTRRRKDGALIDVELYGVPLLEGGRLIGVYALYQDLTEQKRLSEQLRQAQKMEAVGRLAGGVAHDFNNLLTVILGTSDMLLERAVYPHPMEEELREIRSAGERAARLTRQLLAFSRSQVLRPEVLDLNVLLGNAKRMLSRLIGEDIEMKTNLDTALWSVRADPGQIEQVIMNLAVNARDAMPKGGKLTFETRNFRLGAALAHLHRDMAPGEYVEITVLDTGIGMDETTRSRLFEPFFTTKAVGMGTGLGLSTSYGVIKQSGGYIWAESKVGSGTVFRIYLPRIDGEPEAIVERRPAKTVLPRSESILLVEDEPEVRTFIERVLRGQGYQIFTASRPSEALTIASRADTQFDLLVTDVIMPEMDGRELARRLLSDRPTLPVIYLSGYSADAIGRHGVLDPGTAFLEKPFRPDTLVEKVREALEGGGPNDLESDPGREVANGLVQ